MKTPKLAYKIHRRKEGYYVAHIPALGIAADDKSRAKAIEFLAELEADIAEIYAKHNTPFPTYEESVIACDSVKRGGRRDNAGRKASDNPMTETIVINLSKDDKKAIEGVCKDANQPVSAWARAVLYRAAKRRVMIG